MIRKLTGSILPAISLDPLVDTNQVTEGRHILANSHQFFLLPALIRNAVDVAIKLITAKLKGSFIRIEDVQAELAKTRASLKSQTLSASFKPAANTPFKIKTTPASNRLDKPATPPHQNPNTQLHTIPRPAKRAKAC